jgi:hypothetical protein
MALAGRRIVRSQTEIGMTRTLMAIAAAAFFAVPLIAASAGSDRIVVAGADGPDMANRQPGTASSQPGTMSSEKSERSSTQSASGRSADSRFDQLDRNGDGYVSRDEANDAAELHTRFTELDKNNDGKLSREEYNALHEGASGATGSGSAGASGADERRPGRSPAPGKGGGDASTSGANTK